MTGVKLNYTGQQKKKNLNGVEAPNTFLANSRALNLKRTLFCFIFLVYNRFSVKKRLLFEKKAFFYLLFVYMILTDGNISQSKIVETFQFVFKSTNIGLLIEK